MTPTRSLLRKLPAVAALAVSDRQLLERLDPREVEQLEGLLRKVLALLELSE